MKVHRTAEGFHLSADAYERGRPDYPAEAVQAVVRALDIGLDSTVVDLAAGTGKFTRLLVPSGARIIAVEPVAGMRDQLRERVPDVDVRDGTAEAMPVDDGAVDAVTVAQAFHWFATDAALTEIARVLRPGGGLSLIWNERDLQQPLQRSIEGIVQPYRGTTPAHEGGGWRSVMDGDARFMAAGEWQFRHEQEVDADRLVDRVLSTSFIAALPKAEREDVRERVLALARDLPERFSLEYITSIFCFRT